MFRKKCWSRDIKKDTSTFNNVVKRLIYFMCNRLKLIYARFACLKTWLIRWYQIIFNEKLKQIIIYQTLVFFRISEVIKQVGWHFLTLAQHLFYGLEPHLLLPIYQETDLFWCQIWKLSLKVLKWTHRNFLAYKLTIL